MRARPAPASARGGRRWRRHSARARPRRAGQPAVRPVRPAHSPAAPPLPPPPPHRRVHHPAQRVLGAVRCSTGDQRTLSWCLLRPLPPRGPGHHPGGRGVRVDVLPATVWPRRLHGRAGPDVPTGRVPHRPPKPAVHRPSARHPQGRGAHDHRVGCVMGGMGMRTCARRRPPPPSFGTPLTPRRPHPPPFFFRHEGGDQGGRTGGRPPPARLHPGRPPLLFPGGLQRDLRVRH